MRSLAFNRVYFIFFYVSTVVLMVTYIASVILFEKSKFPQWYGIVFLISNIWFILLTFLNMCVFSKVAYQFKNILYEGNEKAKTKANVVSSIILFLMILELICLIYFIVSWYPAFKNGGESPQLNIKQIMYWHNDFFWPF